MHARQGRGVQAGAETPSVVSGEPSPQPQRLRCFRRWRRAATLAGLCSFLSLASGLRLGQAGGEESRLVEAGRRLFEEQCASCHGPAGKSNDPDLDLSDQNWRRVERVDGKITREGSRKVVARGVPETGMLPFENVLSAEEIEAVAAYIFHLKESAGGKGPGDRSAQEYGEEPPR